MSENYTTTCKDWVQDTEEHACPLCFLRFSQESTAISMCGREGDIENAKGKTHGATERVCFLLALWGISPSSHTFHLTLTTTDAQRGRPLSINNRQHRRALNRHRGEGGGGANHDDDTSGGAGICCALPPETLRGMHRRTHLHTQRQRQRYACFDLHPFSPLPPPLSSSLSILPPCRVSSSFQF